MSPFPHFLAKISFFLDALKYLTTLSITFSNGGPTRLPAKGGGQQERPGKAEPLVGWEEGRNQRPQTQLEPVLGGVYSSSVVAPPG